MEDSDALDEDSVELELVNAVDELVLDGVLLVEDTDDVEDSEVVVG